MFKAIFWIAVIGGAVWAYYNVDFTSILPNMVNTASQEKTIKKFDNSNQAQKQRLQEVIDGNY